MKKENENNKIVRLCYANLDKFRDIYPIDKKATENKMPENIKLTVFIQSSNDEGFLINVNSDELGLESLIAKKWIIHSELEELIGFKLK